MADLTYQDIQRAIKDALQNTHEEIRRVENQITSLQYGLRQDVQQSLYRLEQESNRHDPRSEQATQQITQRLNDFDTRLKALEHICQNIEDFIRDHEEAYDDDDDYRRM